MKNYLKAVLTLSIMGSLILSGCGSSGRTSDSPDTSGGLMGDVGTDDTQTDSTITVELHSEDLSEEVIGRYVSQGYENPAFGFRIDLPDNWILQPRGLLAGQDVTAEANSSDTFGYIRTMVGIPGSLAEIFRAESSSSRLWIDLQDINSSIGDYSGWASEQELLQNMEEKLKQDPAEYMGYEKGTEISDLETSVSEISIADKSHQALQITYCIDGVPYYGVDIMMTSEDNRYALQIILHGTDRNEIDQAGSCFTAISEFSSDSYTSDTDDTGSSDGDVSQTAESTKGTLNGMNWQNPYFGVQCTLDSPWVFENGEETADSSSGTEEGADTSYIDMSATIDTDTEYKQVNAVIDTMDESTAGLTPDSFLDAALADDYQGELEAAGLSVDSCAKDSAVFLGETVPAIRISGNNNDVPCYMVQVCVIKDNHYMVITAISAVDDTCQSILDQFQRL